MSEPSDPRGYYRYPTLFGDQLVFVSEDDLWTVPAGGGLARRLTSGRGAFSRPAFSPDGRWLAVSGAEEGHQEVYLLPAEGGELRRLSFLGGRSQVLGWDPAGRVVFTSDALEPHASSLGGGHVYALAAAGGQPQRLPLGLARSVSFEPGGRGVVVGRHQDDPARWKRYRGGTAGDLWIDPQGSGQFRALIRLDGNLVAPIWLFGRIYFLSDHQGVANLYSCNPDGEDLRAHTTSKEYYLRFPSSDGQRITYAAGGDLYLFDPASAQSERVDIALRSPRTQRQRKFVTAEEELSGYALGQEGKQLAVCLRGQVLSGATHDGGLTQHGQGLRRRLPRWLEGGRLLLVSDVSGTEQLELYPAGQGSPQAIYGHPELGRVVELLPAPHGDRVAISNHRNELWILDLSSSAFERVGRSAYSPLQGSDWSPDGRFLAYAVSDRPHRSLIKLLDLTTMISVPLTDPVLRDLQPSFDPLGRYLYFLSARSFAPVADQLQFDYGFPLGLQVCALPLRQDVPSPVGPIPLEAPDPKKEEGKEEGPIEVRIDLEGVERRVVCLPLQGRYAALAALRGGLLLLRLPVESELARHEEDDPPGELSFYDLFSRKQEVLVSGVKEFELDPGRSQLIYRGAHGLRVIKAGERPGEEAGLLPGRQSGVVDLTRFRCPVSPEAEWRQMLIEAWRLQREQFWREDLSGVDWERVLARYQPLLERISCRSEFSDLIWELQGELGTSHAYEWGGDHRKAPSYGVGHLGAELAWDAGLGRWAFTRILVGDPWDEEASSPLARPGSAVSEGELLLAISGRELSADLTPGELLVDQAGQVVTLRVSARDGSAVRDVAVKTLRSEAALRYRQWVNDNRAWVHQRSADRVGYLHVPDMVARGLAEFHRGFLAELDRDGLIVDVRYNSGGNVSELLLAKLARRRIAYSQTRWFGVMGYPEDAPAGPMVALTNEYAGSDGDIFSHNFKQLGLGPLIGKRTWGGVIGIWPRHPLIDGTITTQPEFAFWFKDVGWRVENYGTDPDIEVEFLPQDESAGRDPQLERALEEVMARVEAAAPSPDFGPSPRRELP